MLFNSKEKASAIFRFKQYLPLTRKLGKNISWIDAGVPYS